MGLFNLSRTRKDRKGLSRKLIALAFAVILSVTAFTNSVGAVTKIDAMTPEKAAKAFIYYKALRTCLTNTFMRNSTPRVQLIPPYIVVEDKGTMSKDDAMNYDWFYGGAMQGVIYNPFTYNVTDFGVYDSGNLDGRCTSDDGGKKVFALLAEYTGYTSGPELLCAIGFERQFNNTPEQCTDIGGNNDFIRPSDPGKAIDEWWTKIIGAAGLGTGSLGAGEYDLLFKSFLAGCKVKEGSTGDTTYTIRVARDGKMVPQTYYATDRDVNKNSDIRIYSGTTLKCSELEEALNSLSDRAVLAIIQLLEDGDTYTPETDDEVPTDTSTSCAVDGIGWIVCPVITFAAGLADSMFTILSDNFLKVGINVVNTDPSAGPTTTYNAWRAMQGVANVILVIIFLIIIFSQLTGAGISNYGVKKMLPRIVIAAILINLSFTLCQVAVDVSNILGYSLRDFFTGLAAEAGAANSGAYDTTTNNVLGGSNPWFNLAGGVLAVAAIGTAGFFMMSMLGTVLVAVIVALLMVLLILIARQAIIVLAIVTAPVAIALWLLPNTKSIAEQWWKIFSRMLLLFPIIALIFGGSTLASVILRDSFGSAIEGNENVNWLGQIIAAGIQVIPLIATPLVLKGALSAVPMVGNLASKLSSRANGNIGKKLKAGYQGSIRGRGAAYKKAGMEAKRQRNFAKRVSKGGIDQMFAQGIGFGATNRAGNESLVKAAVAAEQKAAIEEVSAAKAVIENANLSGDQRQELALTGKVTVNGQTYSGEVMQKAAIQEQLAKGSMKEIHQIADASHRDGPLGKFAQTISMGVASNGVASKDPALSGRRIDDIAQGNFDYDGAVRQAIGEGKYTAEAFASMHDDARAKAITVAQQAAAGGDTSLLTALQGAAQGIMASSEISGRIAGNSTATSHINTLLGGSPGGAPLPARRPGP